jgi:3-hydroxybutyryl-CoA dehydrogenase
MDVKTIGVIGAGAMGREIASASIIAGYLTILEDVSPAILEQGVAHIRKTLEASIGRRKMTPEQKQRALENLSTARLVEDVCRQADLLIEALPEELELKLEIFTIFDRFAKPDAILSSATSSISIDDLAGITFRAENCVGMRFHSLPSDGSTLEITRAPETSDATIAACSKVGRRVGSKVVVLRDSHELIPGRINTLQE